MMQRLMPFTAGQAGVQVLALPTHRLCYVNSRSLSWIMVLGGLEVTQESRLNLSFSMIIMGASGKFSL